MRTEFVLLALAAIHAAQAAPVINPAIAPGKIVYDQHCAACHGVRGDGNGPAAVWLFPKPRNFSAGLFKIQSTPAGSLPTDEDLFQTITRGMSGSSMPSFTYLTQDQRREAVQYVKHLTATTNGSGRENLFDKAKGQPQQQPIEVPLSRRLPSKPSPEAKKSLPNCSAPRATARRAPAMVLRLQPSRTIGEFRCPRAISMREPSAAATRDAIFTFGFATAWPAPRCRPSATIS